MAGGVVGGAVHCGGGAGAGSGRVRVPSDLPALGMCRSLPATRGRQCRVRGRAAAVVSVAPPVGWCYPGAARSAAARIGVVRGGGAQPCDTAKRVRFEDVGESGAACDEALLAGVGP